MNVTDRPKRPPRAAFDVDKWFEVVYKCQVFRPGLIFSVDTPGGTNAGSVFTVPGINHFLRASQLVEAVNFTEAFCRDEIDPMLSNALRSIPETFLTPLLLREIHESTYDDIAQTLDIPIGTVMSRLFRARSLLRKALLPEIHPDPHAPQSDECAEEKRKRGFSK